MLSPSPTLLASCCAYFAVSSIVIFAMGISGQTSVAPMRGCSPLCLLMSINSPAFLMALKAASITLAGSPTMVTTVRLVALPGSTFNKRTPSTDSISLVICLMMLRSLPSEKFGTHSISCMLIFCFKIKEINHKGHKGRH